MHHAERADERVAELVALHGLQPHPEGGWYREIFRSAHSVHTTDGRGARAAMTSIDFLLGPGQRSAWHRVASDEAWHLLEGGPLRLWVVDEALQSVQLQLLPSGAAARAVVPAGAWQAAEPDESGLGYAFVGATVGPGFDFADFSFGREDDAFCAALRRLAPELQRLL